MHSNDHINIKVLPFEDLSLQKELGIFCRSFNIDLVTELSRFRQFRVIDYPSAILSSNSTALNKNSPDSISDYFIQGSFRCDKDMVRINLQLYNNNNQLVWANRFEGSLASLSEIQECLLTEVVGFLQQQINYDLLSRIRKKQKVEFRAYEHWLYGMEELKKGSVEADHRARTYFEKAIEIQPDYSLAYSGMSLSYFNEWSCQLWDWWDISKSGAYHWAQKAIEIDDQNYVAALVIGRIFLYERSYETSEFYLRKSLSLNPNDPDTLIHIAASFVFLGLHDEALQLYERTISLSPVNDGGYLLIGSFIFLERGEFEKAASLIVQSKSSRWADADAFYAAIYYHLNEPEKMEAHWQKFLDNYRRLITKGNDFDKKEAIEWLFKINPYRNPSRLEAFLKFINQDSFQTFAEKTAGVPTKAIENYFVREGVAWKVSFEGISVVLPEVKGFHDIRKLLSQPRQLIHCAELMGTTVNARGEKLFDSKAKRQYEKKILELQADIQEAEYQSNFLRLETLQDEYDKLIEHLSQSLGLKGKVREAGNPMEKARSAVTWRIRKAIARIETSHPLLGSHLSNAIKTGTFCSYQPEKNLTWLTEMEQ